jgi:hypothetical protein
VNVVISLLLSSLPKNLKDPNFEQFWCLLYRIQIHLLRLKIPSLSIMDVSKVVSFSRNFAVLVKVEGPVSPDLSLPNSCFEILSINLSTLHMIEYKVLIILGFNFRIQRD